MLFLQLKTGDYMTIQYNILTIDWERLEYFNDYIRTLLAYEKGKTAGITQTFAPTPVS